MDRRSEFTEELVDSAGLGFRAASRTGVVDEIKPLLGVITSVIYSPNLHRGRSVIYACVPHWNN